MVSIELGYLKSYAVEGQLTVWGRGDGAIQWSSDNQVVIVHKKGVNIYECRQTPGVQKIPSVLTVVPSQIDGPGRVYSPDTGAVAVADLMNSAKKQNVFELMRDPILRPHSYDATIFLNYFIKGSWSTVPIYRGLNAESRCILGLLTNGHQLLLYGKTDRWYSSKKGWTEPWELLLDLTTTYNRFLIKSWESSPKSSSQFDHYKSRLYELTILDFAWMPDWDLSPDYICTDDTKGVFKTLLMTFHANGDVCIWKISAARVVAPKYSARVVYKKNLLQEETFSSVAYSLVSSTLALLLVGTNKGRLVAYRVEKCRRVKKEVEDESYPNEKYLIHVGQDLWEEEDMLRIESILVKPQSSDRFKVKILAVKHPNILISTSLGVLKGKILPEKVSVLKVPNGPIVGLSENSDGLLIVSHEAGVLSLVSWEDGELSYIPESRCLIFDPLKIKRRKVIDYGTVQKLDRPKKRKMKTKEKRLIFEGLAVSRNKSLLCVARTVGMYYDHLKIRKPSHIVFYSLLPRDSTWTHVRKLYAENNFSLKAISDALVPFRTALRGKGSSEIYNEILEWAVPLKDKTIEELKLLHWCLKLRPGPPSSEWEVARAEQSYSVKYLRRLTAIDALNKYRTDVVADRIMQRRCASLIKAVLENQDEPSFSLDIEINKQCLHAMYEFLESKDQPVSVPKKPEFNPLPHIPLCYWCKGPLEFPAEKFDYRYQCEEVIDELGTKFDSERITGFKWKSRRHPVKDFGIHRPEIGILSLLPAQFPYRKCQNCSVISLMKPAFGQLPYCPLCDSYMYPAHVPLNVPDAVEQVEEDDVSDECVREERKAVAQNSILPKLERAEPFIPQFFVKEEPEDIFLDKEAYDFSNLPHLTNEIQELPSMLDSADTWAAESVSASEYDSESTSSSKEARDKSSSSDGSGNESDTSTSSEASESESSDSSERDSDEDSDSSD